METNKIIPLIVYPLNNGYVSCINPVINGTGEPDANICLKINNTSYDTIVNQDGIWSINITNTLTDGQSYALEVTQTGKDGEQSPATSVSFEVDTKTLYQHSITEPLNNQFINVSTPKICGTGKPNANIEADISGKIYNTLVDQNGSWNIVVSSPLDEGSNSISVRQKDMGNFSPVVSVNFVVDTVAPSTPVITKPCAMGYEATPTPTINGKAEPDAEVNLIVDNYQYTTKANKSGDWNFEVANSLNDDVHMILAKQKDLAGNISPETVTIFTVKTTTPEKPIIKAPTNGEFLSSGTPVIKGLGNIDSRIEVSHGGKIYSSLIDSDGKWSVKITDELSNGKHSFSVYQVDQAGNVSASETLTIIVDTISPLTPVIIYPKNDSLVNATNFTIKGTAEPEATIELKLAGKNYNTKVATDGSWSIQMTDKLTDQQQYSIILNQLDMARNISPSLRVKFYLDTNYLQAPTVTSPQNDSHINTEYPAIFGTGYVGATVNVNINNTSYTTKVGDNGIWSITTNQKLPQGLNTISTTQVDRGNTSPANNTSFYIDTLSPVAPIIIQPIENSVSTEEKLLIRGLGEYDCTIELKFDNQNYFATIGNDSMWEIEIDSVASGIHTLVATQKDKAGNYSPATTINCVVNNIQNSSYTPNGSPAIGTVSYNPPDSEITTSVIATMTTNKPVIVNNVVGTVFSRTINTNGISKFDFVDLENHPGSVDVGVTWIDDIAPIIDIQSTGNYFSSDKTVNYYKAGPSGLKSAFINGVAFESGKVVKAEGNYTATVCDNAGNTATKSFVIDKTPPTIIGVENGITYNADVNITLSDNVSGIKSATLNGNTFACGTTLTANGQYKLVVTDFGDNTKEINFTIAK